MRKIILKDNEIFKTKCWTKRTRSSNIRINKFKWVIYPLIDSQLIRHMMMFIYLTWLHSIDDIWPNSETNFFKTCKVGWLNRRCKYCKKVEVTHATEQAGVSRWYRPIFTSWANYPLSLNLLKYTMIRKDCYRTIQRSCKFIDR